MKVLIVSSQYPPEQGGGGSHAFYLASELAELGCEVHVLTSTSKGKPSHVYHDQEKPLWIHRVNFQRKESIAHFKAVEAGLRICSQLEPVVVHGQHFRGSHIALRLKAAFGIPLVVTLHKTPEIESPLEKIRRDPSYGEMRFLATPGLVDSFVAGSDAFRDELLLVSGGLPPERVKRIYHGVSHHWLKYRAYQVSPAVVGFSLAQDETLLICPARLDPRKNIELFIEAAGTLVSRLPEVRFRFLVTAEAKERHEKAYLRELQAVAARAGVSALLAFQAFDFYALPAVLRLAKACVLPSKNEGLGLAVLEALALKVPVVASKAKGITEIIREDGDGGLLFESGNAQDLADKLLRLLGDGELARGLARRGYQLIRTGFTGRRMAEEHLNLYRELVGRPTSAGTGSS